MWAVPQYGVFFCALISYFPGMLLRHFSNGSETVHVAPTFPVCCSDISRMVLRRFTLHLLSRYVAQTFLEWFWDGSCCTYFPVVKSLNFWKNLGFFLNHIFIFWKSRIYYVTCSFLGRIVKLRKVNVSFVMCVCLSVCACVCVCVCVSTWNNTAFAGRIFMKFRIWVLLKNLSGKFKFHYSLTSLVGILY
jgi:hypothetical protein